MPKPTTETISTDFQVTDETAVGASGPNERFLPALEAAKGRVVLVGRPADDKVRARLREELHTLNRAKGLGRLTIQDRGDKLALFVDPSRQPIARKAVSA